MNWIDYIVMWFGYIIIILGMFWGLLWFVLCLLDWMWERRMKAHLHWMVYVWLHIYYRKPFHQWLKEHATCRVDPNHLTVDELKDSLTKKEKS